MSELGNEITTTLTKSANDWVFKENIPARTVASALASAAVNVYASAMGPKMTHAFLLELLRQFEHDHFDEGRTIN